MLIQIYTLKKQGPTALGHQDLDQILKYERKTGKIQYLKVKKNSRKHTVESHKPLVLPLCWYLNHNPEAPGPSLWLVWDGFLASHFHPFLLHVLSSQVTANQILALVSTGNRYKTINSVQPEWQIDLLAIFMAMRLLKESKKLNFWISNRKNMIGMQKYSSLEIPS